jgi:hypothetical protein
LSMLESTISAVVAGLTTCALNVYVVHCEECNVAYNLRILPFFSRGILHTVVCN